MKITSTQSVVLIGQFVVEGLLIGFLLYLFAVARSQYRTYAEHSDCPVDCLGHSARAWEGRADLVTNASIRRPQVLK
jgi:hypothetical protein